MASATAPMEPNANGQSTSSSKRDPGDSTAQRVVDIWLLRCGFYHGYLPREDAASLLKNKGDFLVRLSETLVKTSDKQSKRQTSNVISVVTGYQEAQSPHSSNRKKQIKNIVVFHRGGKWYIDESIKFNSAALLFAHYMNNPIMLNNVPVLLQRGVGLCRWEYFHRNVKIAKTIGRGAYGEVKLAELFKRNGEKDVVAVKTLSHEAGSSLPPKLIKEILKEARIMRPLKHPNIVSFLGVVLIDHPLYIILEYVQGGALDSYLRKNKKTITNEERMKIALGVACGMEYLHKVNVIHRDVAARNCLYDKKSVKISDFGLSRKGNTYKMKTMQKMPIKYMAPESLSKFLFSQKSDVYSYGILIYELYACEEPYQGLPSAEIRAMIISGKVSKMPDNVPADIVSFVNEKIWCRDPSARTSFHEIVKFLENKTGLKLSYEVVDEMSPMGASTEGSRCLEVRTRRKASRTISTVNVTSAELNTPKPVYGIMAELAEEHKLTNEGGKKTST